MTVKTRRLALSITLFLLSVLLLDGCNMLFGGNNDSNSSTPPQQKSLRDLLGSMPDLEYELWSSTSSSGELNAAAMEPYAPSHDAGIPSQAGLDIAEALTRYTPFLYTMMAHVGRNIDEAYNEFDTPYTLGDYGIPDGMYFPDDLTFDWGTILYSKLPTEAEGAEEYQILWRASNTYTTTGEMGFYYSKMRQRFVNDVCTSMDISMLYEEVDSDGAVLTPIQLDAYAAYTFDSINPDTKVAERFTIKHVDNEGVRVVDRNGLKSVRVIEYMEEGDYELSVTWADGDQGGTIELSFASDQATEANWARTEICNSNGYLIERSESEGSTVLLSAQQALPVPESAFDTVQVPPAFVAVTPGYTLMWEETTTQTGTWTDEDGTDHDYSWMGYNWYLRDDQSGSNTLVGAPILEDIEYRTSDWETDVEERQRIYVVDLTEQPAGDAGFSRDSTAAAARTAYEQTVGGDSDIAAAYADVLAFEFPRNPPTKDYFSRLE